MNGQIGEATISPQQQQSIAPDVVNDQGKQQLFNQLATATVDKKKLDFIFEGIAKKIGAEFSSRVKNPQTVVQKVAQKRTQGRDYNLEDINDAYGSRIIIKDQKQMARVIQMVKKAADLGVFDINKSEHVNLDYHKAHHIDFQTPNGIKGEVQILTPQEEANSTVNHDLRAVYGEKLPALVKQLADKQRERVQQLPNDKAHQLANVISQLHKATGDKPMSPQVNASLLARFT